ncbi:MAG: hypothetical protein ACM3NQ_22440 [Bacteroidales bacterium]
MLKRLPVSLLPVPGLVVLLAFVYVATPPVVFDPPWLILTGNTIFVGLVGAFASYLAYWNYLAAGRIQILLRDRRRDPVS